MTVAQGAPAVVPTGARRRLFVVLQSFAQGVQGLAIGGIPLFLPLIRNDLKLTFSEAGTLAVSSTFLYALMQIPAGYLSDRFGAKRVFAIGLLSTNLLCINFAQMTLYPLMVANQLATGFFRSLVFAPGLLLMSSLFSRERMSTALGLVTLGTFVAQILLNGLGPILVVPFGWRSIFTAFGIAGLISLFLHWRFGHPGPAGSPARGSPLREMVHLFRYRVMWTIGGIQFVRLAVVQGLSVWMPTYMVLERGYSLQEAGLVVAVGAALTSPSNVIGGYVSDRLRNPYLVIGSAMVILAASTALIVRADTLPALLLFTGINALFRQMYFGALFSVPIKMLGHRTAGRSTGFGNFFANVGGFICAYAIGVLKDASGSFAIGFYLLSIIALGGLVLTIMLSRMKPLLEEQPHTI